MWNAGTARDTSGRSPFAWCNNTQQYNIRYFKKTLNHIWVSGVSPSGLLVTSKSSQTVLWAYPSAIFRGSFRHNTTGAVQVVQTLINAIQLWECYILRKWTTRLGIKRYKPFVYAVPVHMRYHRSHATWCFSPGICQKLVYYKHRICQPRETNECSIIQIGQNNLQCKRIWHLRNNCS